MSELQEMINACCTPGEGFKKGKEIATALLKRMRDCQAKELTVYFCPSDTLKDSALDQPFLISCLLFLLLRTRSLKLKLLPTARPAPKVKKPDVLLRVRVASNQDFSLSAKFLRKAGEMLRQEYKQEHSAALHMDEISIECGGDAAQGHPSELLRRREEAFLFAYHFYESLETLFSGRKLFIFKNQLSLSCRKEDLSAVQGGDLYLLAEEAWTNKILTLQQGFFMQNLFLKVRKAEIFSEFTPISEKGEEEQQVDRPQLGFFQSFSGSPSEYLSNIVLQFATPCSLTFLERILPHLPNLTQIRLTKYSDEMIVPQVNGALRTLGRYCPLVELFWLSSIQVENVALEILRALYEDCPYLTELQLGLPARYLMEGEDEAAQCGRILEIMHLRKVSLTHNLEMAKLLLAKGFTFNEAIEVVDSIEPLTFS